MAETDRVTEQLESHAGRFGIYRCYACGRCTSRCPLASQKAGYSPRGMVSSVTEGRAQEFASGEGLWSCLTCLLCTQFCPSEVEFPQFVKTARLKVNRTGVSGHCSHGGALQSMMKLMAEDGFRQRRLDWIDKGLRTSEKGEYLYFVGCLPYLNEYFSELQLNSLQIAASTVQILNALDIEPVVMKNERCCGHDLLWQGDAENFRKLAQLNLNEIKESGARVVIASCAECARTLRLDYQELFGSLPFRVTHLSEFLAEKVKSGQLPLKAVKATVTYQDPCRLGRHQSVYDPPRDVISAIPGVELREMKRNRREAICCGTSCWTACDRHSRQIQESRLQSANQTGAEFLITACPKCAIHFKCSRYENGRLRSDGIEIQDLAVLVSKALQGASGRKTRKRRKKSASRSAHVSKEMTTEE